MKPISTVPRALRHRRRRDRRAGRARSTSAATSAPCRRPGSWPRRWWPSCWPTRAGEVRRRLASPRRARNVAATSTLPIAAAAGAVRRCRDGAARRARRPARRRQDDGRPRGRRAPRRRRSATPTPTSRPRPGKPVADIFVERRRGAFRRSSARPSPRSGRARRRPGARRRRRARPAHRAGLAGTRVVFLDVGLADAASRVGFTGPRRCCSGTRGPSGSALMEERRPVYEEVATVTVPTDGRTPDERADGSRGAGGAPVSGTDRDPRSAGRRPPPYDVVVGTGLLDGCRRLLGGRARGARCPPAGAARRPARRSARTLRAQGFEARRRRGARRRGGQDRCRSRAFCGRCSGRRASPAPTPSWSRRGSRHRPRRIRRRHLAARRPGRAGPDHVARRWSTPPSAARPASTPRRARTSSAPSTRRPACSATSTTLDDSARATSCRRAGRGRQVRVHRRPGDPRPRRGRPGGRCSTRRGRGPRELVERSVRVKADVVVAGPARVRACARSSTTATPSATRSSGSSTTSGATARRSRSAWSSPPSWAGWPAAGRRGRRPAPRVLTPSACPPPTGRTAGRSCSRPCAGQEDRGDLLRFVVLDDLARPARLEGPDPSLLVAAYTELGAGHVSPAT